MASKSRHSNYSRRAQYGTFTGYVIAGIGALIGALLLGLSLWQPESFQGPRNLSSDVIIKPVGETSAFVRVNGQNIFDSISGYFAAGRQNAKLKTEVQLARIRLAEANAVAEENIRLKELLALTTSDNKPVAITRMIGSTSSSVRRFAYIGAGAAAGVKAGMSVRSPRGVIGRILEVSNQTARVLLLTDSQSTVPVRLAGSNVVALAKGRGDGQLQIQLVNLGVNPLEQGDMLVTSGSGGYYQPGIAVAVVAEVTDDGAIARIVSDPAATDFVTVQPVWQPEATQSAQSPDDRPLVP